MQPKVTQRADRGVTRDSEKDQQRERDKSSGLQLFKLQYIVGCVNTNLQNLKPLEEVKFLENKKQAVYTDFPKKSTKIDQRN